MLTLTVVEKRTKFRVWMTSGNFPGSRTGAEKMDSPSTLGAYGPSVLLKRRITGPVSSPVLSSHSRFGFVYWILKS